MNRIDTRSRPRPGPAMSKLIAIAALGCALAAGPAAAADAPPAAATTSPAQSYSLDASHTTVHWEVLHMGTSTIRGRFERAVGSVAFDAAARRIAVGITIDTASASTGLGAFDSVLKGSSLLAVQEHPQAFFTARRATWDGEAPREIHGEITLRGVSQPLTLRASRWKCGLNLLFRREVCGGDFDAVLKRSEFGMTLALGFAADEVQLRVQVEAVRDDSSR